MPHVSCCCCCGFSARPGLRQALHRITFTSFVLYFILPRMASYTGGPMRRERRHTGRAVMSNRAKSRSKKGRSHPSLFYVLILSYLHLFFFFFFFFVLLYPSSFFFLLQFHLYALIDLIYFSSIDYHFL